MTLGSDWISIRLANKPKHCSNESKEISIRDLQFQQKMKDLQHLEQLNDEILKELEKKQNVFRDVLVKSNSKRVHSSLWNYNTMENTSVERVTRSRSNFISRPLCSSCSRSKTVTKLRARPTFDIVSGQLYKLTEKEEDSKWNDITVKHLEDQVRNSINDVNKVLKLGCYEEKHSQGFRNLKEINWDLSLIRDHACKTPSPRSWNFNNLIKSNQQFAIEKSHTPTIKNSERICFKAESKGMTSEDYIKLKFSTSPNFRYKYVDQNTAVSSHENKVVVGDEFKMFQFCTTTEEKPSSKQTDSESNRKTSVKEDSICEYNELEWSPQFNLPRKLHIEERIDFRLRLEEVEPMPKQERPYKREERKEIFIHPKFELLASQLPLHSISEDVNSPNFASSNSNIGSYFNRNGTPKKIQTDVKHSEELSNNTESQDHDASGEKHHCSGTIPTTTSVSENFIETANIENLENKLDRILSKRSKRIQIFENYLNEWENEKIKQMGEWEAPRNADFKSLQQVDFAKKSKTAASSPVKSKKVAAQLYVRPRGILQAWEPVLSKRQTVKNKKRP